MTHNRWHFTDAKNNFNRVIDKALDEGPQIVSRNDREAVVILSIKEYSKLAKSHQSLLQFFRQSPLVGVQLELERDRSYPQNTKG